jgi:hypothetical protein
MATYWANLSHTSQYPVMPEMKIITSTGTPVTQLNQRTPR